MQGTTYGAYLQSSAYSTISQSTMVGVNTYGLYLTGSDTNTFSYSFIRGGSNGAYLASGSDGNSVSFSTLAAVINAGLLVDSSDRNTVTRSHMEAARYGAQLLNGADDNSVSLSTMAGRTLAGLSVAASDRNSFDRSLLSGWIYGAALMTGSDSNAVSRSTLTATDGPALYAVGADSNTLAHSLLSSTSRALWLDAGADGNVISLSTMIGAGAGNAALYLYKGSSNTIVGSYVQGSTAAFVLGSTGTVFGGTVFVATNTYGSALAFGGGVNLTIATSTLISPSLGRGLYLNPGSAGMVSLGSVTFTGAARGIEVSTQGASFSLAVDSITFRGLASGATAIHFLGGTFTSTITLANFEDTTTGANVSAAALNAASRITMNAHYGARTGPVYENDPAGLVDWQDLSPPYPGCVVTRNVGAGQAYATISAGVAALPATLTGHSCVVVRDAATYNEQVTVEGFTNNGSSISIFTDPAAGAWALVDPPAASTAAFRIANASVNVMGLDIRVDQNIPYGVFASSSHVQLSSVSVSTSGSLGIYEAGVRISSWSAISYSSVTVWNAHGYWLDSATMTTVSYSTAVNKASGRYTVFLDGGKNNEFTVLFASNSHGGGLGLWALKSATNTVTRSYLWGGRYGVILDTDSDFNTISLSTMIGNVDDGLFIDSSDSNTVTQSYMRGGQFGATLTSVAGYNAISLSTMIGNGIAGLYIDSSDSNTVTQSYLWGVNFGALLEAGADYNTIRLSTMIGGTDTGFYAGGSGGADSNTVTQSYMWGSQRGVRLHTGADYNTISLSTMIGTTYGLYAFGADSNTVTQSSMRGGGFGAALDSGADYNAISLSTMIGNSSEGLYVNNADSNTVTQSYLWGGGFGASLNSGADYNAVSLSTMIGNSDKGLYVWDSDSNTVTQSYLWGGSDGAVLDSGADYNAISLSTMTGSAGYGFYSLFADWNSVTQSYLWGGSRGAVLDTSSDYNAISLSTVIGNGQYGLLIANADSNAVTQSSIRGVSYAVYLGNGSDYNAISLSTMIGDNTGLYVWDADSNTVTQSYIWGASWGARLDAGSDYNAISLSTMIGSGNHGLFAESADSNTVTQSYLWGAQSGAVLDIGSDYNAISLSTMVGSSYGLYILQSASNTFSSLYVQGSTAAFVSGSTGTMIGGSIFVATNTAGSALAFAGGVNLMIATSTLISPSSGRGLALNPGNVGIVSLGSVTFSGAARGIEVSTQGALFSLAVDSVTFRGLASGATAIHFLGGTFVSTITLANFEDATTGANVSAAALNAASRITMNAHYGARTRPVYENDPNSLVDWQGYASYPGCVVTKNVGAGQAYATITAGVAALPAVLTGHSCVVVRDAATYNEQVTVQNFTNNGSSITILTDPAVGSNAVVDPPAASTAAFLIANASVNVYGIDIKPTVETMPYGVYASSSYARISSVNVDGATLIWQAGMRLSSWTAVEYASVTSVGAHGFWLAGATATTVSYSSAVAGSLTAYAAYLQDASSSTFTVFYATNAARTSVFVDAASHRVTFDRATLEASRRSGFGGYNLFVDGSSFTLVDSYVRTGGNMSGISIDGAQYVVRRTTDVSVDSSADAPFNATGDYGIVDGLFAWSNGYGSTVDGVGTSVSVSTFISVVNLAFESYASAGIVDRVYVHSDGYYAFFASMAGGLVTNSTFTSVSHAAITYSGGSSVFDNIYAQGASPANATVRLNAGSVLKNSRVYDAGGYSGVRLGTQSRIEDSFINSASAPAVLVDPASDLATVVRSTMLASSGYGIQIMRSSQTWVVDSYVQGATAVYVSGSTGTVLSGSVFVATNTAGSALALADGSVNLSIATSTLLAPSMGRGLALNPDNKGVVSLSSVIFTGAARGIEISTQVAGSFILAVDSVTFRGLASGATAIHFLGGTFVSTITLANFEDATTGANVSAAALNAASRITMNAHYGARTRPVYENDPNSLVDWQGYASYPGCVVTNNVGAGQAYATIQAGVNALPATLTGHSCVVIRDGATYGEQVTVKNFVNSGSSITILADPGSGLRPVVSPPVASTAAFLIANASVNVTGLDIVASQNVPFGISASSGYVSISSVNVSTSGSLGIYTAGVRISSWSAVSYSSVTVWNAHGLWLDSTAKMAAVSYSTFSAKSASFYALYANGASTNTFTAVLASNLAGHGAYLDSGANYNTINQSTMSNASGFYFALYLVGASSNTISRSYLTSPTGIGARLVSNANYNTISLSTVACAGANAALSLSGASYNSILQSYLTNTGSYAAEMLANSNYNTISQSSVTSSAAGYAAVAISAASSNTITQSYMANPAGNGAYLTSNANYNTISQSTMASGAGGSRPLFLNGASYNTVTQSYLTNSAGDAAYIYGGSNGNTISLSTMACVAAGSSALYIDGSSSNTITQSYMANPAGSGAYLSSNANYNTISQSTMTSNAGIYRALYLSGASSNKITRSFLANPAGDGARLDSNSNYNTISESTMTSGAAGKYALYLGGASSNTIVNSYVQGSTAAIISGSTGTVIGGSVFVATNTSGSALAFAGGSVNLTIATSTLISPSLGRGLALNPGNVGVVTLGSVTFSGAARGIEVSTQGALFTLAADSVTFRGLASGATAIHFLGGTFTSTITLANFESANIGANVSGAALNTASRITMNAHYGARTGRPYENDPNGLVDWPSDVLLLAPAAGAAVSTSTPVLAWSGTGGFRLQLALDAGFAQVIADSATANAFYVSTNTLAHGAAYWWRVSGGVSDWSAARSFLVDLGSPTFSAPQVATNAATGPWTSLPMATYLSSNVVTARIVVRDLDAGLRVSTGLPTGLVGHWHLDESSGSVALDASTQTNNGLLLGDPARTAGKRAMAIDFDAIDDAVQVPYSSSMDVPYITVSAWVYKNSVQAAQYTMIATRQSGTAGGDLWFLGYEAGSNKYIFCGGGGCVSSETSVADVGRWVHLTATSDGATLRLYVDGLQIAQDVTSGPLASETSPLCIGAGANDATRDCTSEIADAVIDEVRLYGVALSSAEILAQYQADSLAAHNRGKAYGVLYSTNAGASWSYVSTNSVTLSGADGDTGAQTLQASDIPLVTSTGPGASTNRVAFVAADYAGNVSTASYVVLVDTAAAYPGCAVTRNVGAGQAYATISAGVAALPATLTGHSCVVVRDAATYNEQVTVEGFTNNGSSISIFTDPAAGAWALVDPPAASTAAFRIANASVNVMGLDIRVDQNIPYGVWASSAYVQISSVNISTSGSLGIYTAGVRISSWSAIGYSSVTAWNAHGLWLDGSTMTAVSYSTFQAKNLAFYALYVNGASSNTFTVVVASNTAGYAAYLNAGAKYNTISQSSMTSNRASYAALYLTQASSNTITRSYMTNVSGHGAHLDTNATYNTISQSTMTTNNTTRSALYLGGAAYNTITQSYIANPLYIGAHLDSNADYNTISQSTMTCGGAGNYALQLAGLPGASYNTITQSYMINLAGGGASMAAYPKFNTISQSTMVSGAAGYGALWLYGASSNTFSQSYITNPTGHGAVLDSNSQYNKIIQSTVTSNTANKYALSLTGVTYNTITQSYIANPAGDGAYLTANANYNTISQSTMTSAAAGYRALYITGSSSNTILDSYVQGSTAVYVSGSTGTVIGGTVFVATNTAGSALALADGSVNLTIATSTLIAPSLGRGLALNPGNVGVVALGSVTFSGAARGIEVSTQGALFSLAVDSVTFRGLASGATAIHFLGGTFVSTITLANFEDATTGANVSGAALALASRVTMRAARGPRQGPAYENDPSSLVDWPELLPPSGPAIFSVGLSSIGVQYGVVNADGYVVEASTMADFSGVLFASATLAQAAQLAPQSLDPNTTYFLRTGALWGGATMYSQTTLSTATLTKLASGATVYQIHVTSMIVNWLPLALAPPDASSNSAAGYRLEVSTRPDFTPLWTSSQTPNVALSTLTVDSLRGEVT
jgi:hypothetical protein